MEARNCPRCGKVFTYMSSSICPDCEKKEETTFQALKEYIDENPMCTMRELSEGTGVSPKKINSYIRDGRLEISKGMHGEIKCNSCGRSIARGRFCDKCIIEINQTVGDLFSGDGKKGPRMHTKSRKKL